MIKSISYVMQSFIRDSRGISSMEYGFIVALVTIGIIGAVTKIGTWLSNVITLVGTSL